MIDRHTTRAKMNVSYVPGLDFGGSCVLNAVGSKEGGIALDGLEELDVTAGANAIVTGSIVTAEVASMVTSLEP